MNNKTKKILIFSLILFLLGVIYLSIELIFPREFEISGTLYSKDESLNLEKSERNSQYYISFNDTSKKKIEIECNKQQYDFIVNDREYYIIYRLNFFNRKKAKIIMLDDKPIYNDIK